MTTIQAMNKSKSQLQLALAENLSFKRIREIEEVSIPGSFDAAHLRRIHEHIFQDFAQLHGAGLYRPDRNQSYYYKNRVLEGGQVGYLVYYPIKNMGIMVEQALQEFGGPERLRGLNQHEASMQLASLYGRLDYAHPFREGNSRTLRIFISQLASEAGFDLDWSKNNANAKSRNELYIARDLAVLDQRYPGLDEARAMATDDREEYEAWATFAMHFQEHPRLEHLIFKGLTQSGQRFSQKFSEEEQASIHDDALKQLASSVQELSQHSHLQHLNAKDLGKITYHRNILKGAIKNKSLAEQTSTLARFDELMQDKDALRKVLDTDIDTDTQTKEKPQLSKQNKGSDFDLEL